jgi:glucosamine-6-phosphate deaminase
MSIKQIMRSRAIVCTVPDRRKALAVHDCLTGEVSRLHPASILRQHERAYLFLDAAAAIFESRGPERG